MSLSFLLPPGESVRQIEGWETFIDNFSTLLGDKFTYYIPQSLDKMWELIAQNSPTLIYARPSQSMVLLRDGNYFPLASPLGKSHEVAIITPKDAPLTALDALKPGARIALLTSPNIQRLGLELIQSVNDYYFQDYLWRSHNALNDVLEDLATGEADAAFLCAETFHQLSSEEKANLQLIAESHSGKFSRQLLAHRRLFAQKERIEALLNHTVASSDAKLLCCIGAPQGFVS